MLESIEQKCTGPCGLNKLISEFYTCKRDGIMSMCKACVAIKNAKAYENNRETRLANQNNYAQEHKTETSVRGALYYQKHRKRILAERKIYAQDNKKKIAASQKIYRQENKKDLNVKKSIYNKNNPHIERARGARRRSEKAQRIPAWVNLEAIKQVYADCEEINIAARLAGCTEKFVVDHIIPLKGKLVSGLHIASNLQIITDRANLKKSNKFTP